MGRSGRGGPGWSSCGCRRRRRAESRVLTLVRPAPDPVVPVDPAGVSVEAGLADVVTLQPRRLRHGQDPCGSLAHGSRGLPRSRVYRSSRFLQALRRIVRSAIRTGTPAFDRLSGQRTHSSRRRENSYGPSYSGKPVRHSSDRRLGRRHARVGGRRRPPRPSRTATFVAMTTMRATGATRESCSSTPSTTRATPRACGRRSWAEGAEETDGTHFDSADVDGRFGPNTRGVTEWLQSEWRLGVDGVVSRSTCDDNWRTAGYRYRTCH